MALVDRDVNETLQKIYFVAKNDQNITCRF